MTHVQLCKVGRSCRQSSTRILHETGVHERGAHLFSLFAATKQPPENSGDFSRRLVEIMY